MVSLLCLGLGFSRLGEAQEMLRTSSLAILPVVVQGPREGAAVADLYRAVAGVTQDRLGLRLISEQEILNATSEGLDQRIADCGTDAGCIASKLRMFDAQYALLVLVSFELEPAIYSLLLLDTDRGTQMGELVGEVDKGANLATLLATKSDSLLSQSGFVPTGRVVVDVDPANTRLRLTSGETPDPGSVNVFTLVPGHYTVHGSSDGFLPAEAVFDVHGAETQRISMSLSSNRAWWKSPWLWTAVGVVAVGAGTAAFVRSQRPPPCICLADIRRPCACD